LYQPDKPAVAEHSTVSGHLIKFPETEVLAKTSGCMARLVKEPIEIRLHPNINNEEGFKLSKAQNPSTRLLRHPNAQRLGKSQDDKHREERPTNMKK
jgi:hypothetical protein